MADRRGPWPPDFLILGAQKCGTTSLASALRSHPDIFIPYFKEAHHFGSVDDADVGGADYVRFFDGWRGEPLVGEATPEYLFLPRSAEQICRALPDVKGIVVLRNPVDRAYSAYWHRVRSGRTHRSFADDVDDEFARRSLPAGSTHNLVERGRYVDQLERYLDLGFDRDRLLVVFLEELQVDPAGGLRAIQQFLGVEPVLTTIPRENPSSTTWLPRRARRFVATHFRTHWAKAIEWLAQRPFDPPPMDPALRARLVEHFRPHNVRLATLLGRELPGWDR